MKKIVKNTFWFKYKNCIQAIIAMLIVLISWHPKIYLHPAIIGVLIIVCYAIHSFFENKIILKKLLYKFSKQEKIITAIYENAEELIAYRDVNGNFIYCNEHYLKAFDLSSTIIGETNKSYFCARVPISILVFTTLPFTTFL